MKHMGNLKELSEQKAIRIEKAVPADADDVEELYGAVCDYLEDKEYNPGWHRGSYPTRDEVEFYLKDDTLYVARMDGKVVGSIVLSESSNAEADEELRYEKENTDGSLYVHTFVTHPDYHRRGIGSAMLQFAERIAREQGMDRLRLYVYEKNSVAIRAYERNGFVFQCKEDIGLGEYGLKWFCLYEKELVYV